MRNFWRLPYFAHQTQILQISICRASRTPRAIRLISLILRSAAHSVIPIFRSAAKGSDRRDLMENLGLTFKLILTDTLCSGIESTFLCCANAQYQRPPAAILRRKLVTIGSGHESNHRSLEYIGTTKGYQALFRRFNGPGSITKLPCNDVGFTLVKWRLGTLSP